MSRLSAAWPIFALRHSARHWIFPKNSNCSAHYRLWKHRKTPPEFKHFKIYKSLESGKKFWFLVFDFYFLLLQIHDFGPLGNESNWCLAESVTGKLDEIYDSFGNMFMTAPIVRSTHSHFPVIDYSETITKKEGSFVIFSGQDAENLATSCYQGLTQDKKLGNFLKLSSFIFRK